LLFIFLYTNKKKSHRLAVALEDRETLLKEIHHRVKNNLQIVSSLLNLQTRYIKDDSAISAVKDSKNRVNSMALIHQKLYQNDSLTGVEMNEYVHDLAETLFDSFGLNENQLTVDIKKILLDVDTVIPIGLILNELIINAIKHNDPKGMVLYIGFRKNKNTLELEVKDNGKGIPDSFDYSKSESYGMKLIHSLAKKLNANVIFENDKGLKILIIINDFKVIERV
jgi:two-component sensor histidine kinase